MIEKKEVYIVLNLGPRECPAIHADFYFTMGEAQEHMSGFISESRLMLIRGVIESERRPNRLNDTFGVPKKVL